MTNETLLTYMPPTAIVETIDHIWGNTDKDDTEATEMLKALWQQLTDLLDYYTALGMIEDKMSGGSYLDFCEVVGA